MASVRAEIDLIDVELMRLAAPSIYRHPARGRPQGEAINSLVPWRVEQVWDNVRSAAVQADFDVATAERIWRYMMSECIELERRLITARG